MRDKTKVCQHFYFFPNDTLNFKMTFKIIKPDLSVRFKGKYI